MTGSWRRFGAVCPKLKEGLISLIALHSCPEPLQPTVSRQVLGFLDVFTGHLLAGCLQRCEWRPFHRRWGGYCPPVHCGSQAVFACSIRFVQPHLNVFRVGPPLGDLHGLANALSASSRHANMCCSQGMVFRIEKCFLRITVARHTHISYI